MKVSVCGDEQIELKEILYFSFRSLVNINSVSIVVIDPFGRSLFEVEFDDCAEAAQFISMWSKIWVER